MQTFVPVLQGVEGEPEKLRETRSLAAPLAACHDAAQHSSSKQPLKFLNKKPHLGLSGSQVLARPHVVS